jgi:hypothetical protein
MVEHTSDRDKPTLEIARENVAAGLSVIPIAADGTKAPTAVSCRACPKAPMAN